MVLNTKWNVNNTIEIDALTQKSVISSNIYNSHTEKFAENC